MRGESVRSVMSCLINKECKKDYCDGELLEECSYCDNQYCLSNLDKLEWLRFSGIDMTYLICSDCQKKIESVFREMGARIVIEKESDSARHFNRLLPHRGYLISSDREKGFCLWIRKGKKI